MFRRFPSKRTLYRLFGQLRTTAGTKCKIPIVLSAAVVAPASGTKKFTAEEDLLPEHVIRRAAALTVDSACTLLNQVASTLLNTLDDYLQSVETLIRLMEMNLNALGSNVKEDQVWQSMLTVRGVLAECKQRKSELEIMYAVAEKTLNAAAEAAFSSGSEYHGTAGGDCVRLAQSKIQTKLKQCADAEVYLQEMEVKTIEETTRFAKEQEKQQNDMDGT